MIRTRKDEKAPRPRMDRVNFLATKVKPGFGKRLKDWIKQITSRDTIKTDVGTIEVHGQLYDRAFYYPYIPLIFPKE